MNKDEIDIEKLVQIMSDTYIKSQQKSNLTVRICVVCMTFLMSIILLGAVIGALK